MYKAQTLAHTYKHLCTNSGKPAGTPAQYSTHEKGLKSNACTGVFVRACACIHIPGAKHGMLKKVSKTL
eukprot:scaffold150840_cov15-Tisochrysis_lutea.AAC.1